MPDQASSGQAASRYERVKEILDTAAGASAASYQGRGRFWRLPLEEFLEVTVYGVRMIAPVEDDPCGAVAAVSGALTAPDTGPGGSLSPSGMADASAAGGEGAAGLAGEGEAAPTSAGEAVPTGPAAEAPTAGEAGATEAAGPGSPGTPVTVGTLEPGANALESAAGGLDAPAAASGAGAAGQRAGAETAPAHGGGGCQCCAPAGDAAGAGAVPGGGTAGFRRPRQPGRGARSGLIKGLKGEFPFDGSHFPRLMWGGNAVAGDDIFFIQQWIDDGCPDEPLPDPARLSLTRSRAVGLSSHPVSLRPTNAYRHEAGEIKQRKNVEHLSEYEIANLRCAVQYLKALPETDYRNFRHWGKIHGDQCQHGWEQFLPWHRMFLYYFEQLLQDISPDITLPYWDWTMPKYNKGRVPEGAVGGIVPTIYRCWMTREGLAALATLPAKYLAALPAVGVPFNSGADFFAVADNQFRTDPQWPRARYDVEQQLAKINPLWHPLRYPGIFTQGSLADQLHHHYPTDEDREEMLDIPTFAEFGGGSIYDDSFGDLDMNPHNTMHIWSGGQNPNTRTNGDGRPADPDWGPSVGDMLNNLTAAYDPIFWAHHSNVDRMWVMWQERHPDLGPADLTGVLRPFAETVGDTLSIARLGYEYVRSSYLFETEQHQHITQFKSAPAGVHDGVLSRHRKAEVVLHDIIQPNQSMIMRVFINQPDANIHTPIRDNKHYAGYLALFGHGPCIGGPGHCDPPPPRRAYDRRPRHHNEPWKARLDVTSTVKQLVADGATDLEINIVVAGADGQSTTDMLRLNAVSLTFKD